MLNGGAGNDRLLYTDESESGGAIPAADVSNVEEIYLTAIGGTGAVDGVDEQQTLALSGSNNGGTDGDVTFLGITANVSDGTLNTPAKIAADIAGQNVSATAKALGINGITAEGAVLTLTYDAARGDVSNLSSQATSNGISFSAASELVSGSKPVTAQGGDITVDAGNYDGVEQFSSERSTQKVTVEKLADGQAVGMEGNGNITNGDIDAAYKDAAKSGSLAITGGTTAGAFALATDGASATSTGVEEFTIAATGSEKNTVGAIDLSTNGSVKTLNVSATADLTTGDLTIADTETINISGAGAFTATTASGGLNGVKTIDGSDNSGGVDIDLEDNANDVTVTGGSGDDRVDFADALTKADTVDLGAGTDTVAIEHGALSATDVDGLTNVERLEFTDTASNPDLSLVDGSGITTFVWSGGGDIDPTKNDDSYSHIVTADATNFTPEPATDGLSNTLNLELVDADVDQVSDAAGAGDFETLNLTSSKASDGSLDGSANIIDTEIDIGSSGTVNIDGDAALRVDAVIGAVTVDASDFTANLDITTSTSSSDVTAGSGDDTIDVLAGTNVVDISAGGKDTIDISNVAGTTTVKGFSSDDTLDIEENGGDEGENSVTEAQNSAVDPTSTHTQIVELDASSTSVLSSGTETVADFTDTTDVAAYLEEGFSIANGGENFIFILNDGTDSYVYDFNNANGTGTDDTTIEGVEISLVGTIEGFVLTEAEVSQTS